MNRGICQLILALPLAVAICTLGTRPLMAQEEESAEAKQYREDYERVMKITAIADPAKRADALLTFTKERHDSKMSDYVRDNLLSILDSFVKAEKTELLQSISDRYIRLRPGVGETYYFLGVALKNQRKWSEAMDALAKCIVLKNRISGKAREFLEYIYKGQNRGDLTGIDKIIKKAQADLGK